MEKVKNINELRGFYDNINYNILGKIIYLTKGGPQGIIVIPIIFSYYIEKTINNN